MKIRTPWFSLAFIVACLLGASVASATESVTLGILAYLPKAEILKRYAPIAEHLNKALGDINIDILPALVLTDAADAGRTGIPTA